MKNQIINLGTICGSREEIEDILAGVLARTIKMMPARERRLKKRRGGVFTLGIVYEERVVVFGQFAVGEMTPESLAKRQRLSAEKAVRLWQHPEHMASRESKDEDHEMYAGAKRYPIAVEGALSIIISFSGFLEEYDELAADNAAAAFGLSLEFPPRE